MYFDIARRLSVSHKVAWSSPVKCEGSIADSSHRTIGGETCHIDCIGGDEDDGGSKGVSR